jgi:hypothetical protein
MDHDTATRWWIVSLGIGAVVIGVVAALLMRIIRAADSIDGYASDIWDAGQKIAGNTASIWMLGDTNAVAGQILATAQSIDGHAAAIDKALAGAAAAEPDATDSPDSQTVKATAPERHVQ